MYVVTKILIHPCTDQEQGQTFEAKEAVFTGKGCSKHIFLNTFYR